MSVKRFFVRPIKPGLLELVETEAHHAIHVLRVIPGQVVEVFDGWGQTATAEITRVSSKKVELCVGAIQLIGPNRAAPVILAASVPKGERFDWLITKATELGVNRIIPLLCDRTVKQPKNKNACERYQRLAVAAAKQAGQVFLPQIDEPLSIKQCLGMAAAEYPGALSVFGSPDPGVCPAVSLSFHHPALAAYIGPEGGFSVEEERMLIAAQVQPVRLTNSILRVETAALALAVLLTCFRDASIPHG